MTQPISLLQAVGRGFAMKCPNCGKGHLFRRFLKVADTCEVCSEDFTAQIGQLKANNCEIACGIFNPPQFVTFWTQCAQQGYRPKIMTPPKAILFPSAVEALGTRGTGTSTEVWWSQHHPYKSGLTGETAQQFCDAYTAATGKQWTQPIGFKHANIEVAIDALKLALALAAVAEASPVPPLPPPPPIDCANTPWASWPRVAISPEFSSLTALPVRS